MTSVTIFCLKNVSSEFHPPFNRSFCERPGNINLGEDNRKTHTCKKYRPVTFVTHMRVAVLFFLASCCINSLIL